MTIGKTCICGRRVAPGQRCECGAGRPSEADRLAAQPWRLAYRLPSFRRNRLVRYRLAGGYCESCGRPLVGELHATGYPWQADHDREARYFLHDLDAANAVDNLRVYCSGRGGCHVGGRKPDG